MAENQDLSKYCRPKDSRKNVAAIFGVTGLVGKQIARNLLSKPDWKKVYGIARRPDFNPIKSSNFHFISCDLLDPLETQQKLSVLKDVTHLFWVTWASQFPLDTKECCLQNKAMMSNALDSLLPIARSIRHVSLQTGMKHYLSLIGDLVDKETPYDEESPRVKTGNNFYYVQEDLLKERLVGKVTNWAIHRPGLIMGSSNRACYNFMGTLCVYGAICKYLNLPFVFGGTRKCWEEIYIDGSDARLVAEQHIWAASTIDEFGKYGQAFNAVNGPNFTWKEIWAALGMKLGVEVHEDQMYSCDFRYAKAMGDKKGVWKEIVEKEGLVKTEMDELANWDFLDILFRFPVRMLGTRDKVDHVGFSTRYKTLDSILYWIGFMRHEKLVP